MTTSLRWTSADLELMPDNGKRYEILEGELHTSRQPDWHDQFVCLQIGAALQAWSSQTGAGIANIASGIISDEDDDVAPDVVWVRKERLPALLAPDGKLHAAPI